MGGQSGFAKITLAMAILRLLDLKSGAARGSIDFKSRDFARESTIAILYNQANVNGGAFERRKRREQDRARTVVLRFEWSCAAYAAAFTQTGWFVVQATTKGLSDTERDSLSPEIRYPDGATACTSTK